MALPGSDYFPYGGDAGQIIDAIGRFVASHRAEQAGFDPVLATVLFTDIVGSTERAAEMGDRPWKSYWSDTTRSSGRCWPATAA